MLRAWKKEMDIQLEEGEWEAVNTLVHSGFTNVSVQESDCKLKSKWYRTPSLLYKIYLSVIDRCWCCGKDESTMGHIWCSCQLLH